MTELSRDAAYELMSRWADALESGQYAQGKDALYRIEDSSPSYCCLGVLCDLALQSDLPMRKFEPCVTPKGNFIIAFGYGDEEDHEASDDYLPFSFEILLSRYLGDAFFTDLPSFNDGKEASNKSILSQRPDRPVLSLDFKQIARIIRNRLKHGPLSGPDQPHSTDEPLLREMFPEEFKRFEADQANKADEDYEEGDFDEDSHY